MIVSRNEGPNLRRTVHNLLATLPADGELIVVDDASTDASADFLSSGYPTVHVVSASQRLGAAAARNRGAEAASGEVVVFCDAHVEPPFDWVRPLCSRLERSDVGAVGPAVVVMGDTSLRGFGFTWSDQELGVEWLAWRSDEPYAVPMLGAFFLAMRRDVFASCGGFDEGLVGWGGEDAELCTRLWRLGYECVVVPTLDVAHLFRDRLPHLEHPGSVVHNLLRIAMVHFGAPALARVLTAFRDNPYFPEALAQVIAGDAAARRRELADKARHDDAWFFHRFDIAAFNGTREEGAT